MTMPDISEWEQAMACPYCGQGGFRSEAELQEHIARYHEPSQYVPKEGYSIIIPGELVRGADGKFYDWNNYKMYVDAKIYLEDLIPIHPNIAQQMIADYQATAQPEAPDLELTPIGRITVDGDVYLQYEDQFGEIHTDPNPISKAEDIAEEYVPQAPPDIPPAAGYDWYWTGDRWAQKLSTREEDLGMTEWQEWQTEFLPYQFEQEQEQEKWRLEQQFGQTQQDYELNKWRLEQQFNQAQQELDADLAYQEWQMGYIPHEAQQEYELNRWKLEQEFELERQNLELSQAQLQQEQANYLADLSAHPRSWLEYSMAAGTTPVVQPWMMPLSPGEYPELAGLQAGQPIPGWPTDWSGAEAYAPPVYSPVDMGVEPIAPPPEYTPFIPPTTPPFEERYPQFGETPMEYAPSAFTPSPEMMLPPATVQGAYNPPIPISQMGDITGLSPEESRLYNLTYSEWRGLPEGPEKRLYHMLRRKQASNQRAIDETLTPTARARAEVNVAKFQQEMGLAEEAILAKGGWEIPEEIIPRPYTGYGGSFQNIPSMQYGGWVNKPTVAMIGEKEPELVTPLSQMWNNKPPRFGGTFQTPASAISTKYGGTARTGSPAQTPITRERMGETQYADTPQARKVQQLLASMPRMGTQYQEQLSPLWGEGGYAMPYQPQYGGGTTTSGTPTGGTPTGGGYPGISDPYYPLGGLPNLTRPSRQYQARMGPTAMAQYEAYMQATSGITPEELQWRLWNLAPPGGQYRGLSYVR